MGGNQRLKSKPTQTWENMKTPHGYGRQSACLQDSLQLHHLLLLRDSFCRKQSVNSRSRKSTGACDPSSSGGTLRLDEIRSVLTTTLGEACWTSQMEELFQKADILTSMDGSRDGCVSWEKLCVYILQQHKQTGDSSEANHDVFSSEPLIRHCLHNKQEPITRIVEVSHPPPLRYVTISKGGNMIVWNSNLRAVKTLELSGDTGERSGSFKKFHGWTTDAIYMPNVHKIAVATMSRDIRLFDVSSSACFEEFRLFGNKPSWGVHCFDISWSLNVLVTAGLEPSIRMWNRYVTSRPVSVLHGHTTTVVDVLIHQALARIFSYSKDAVLKIWDIQSQYCVKTLPLRFPNIQVGLSPEHGSFPLLLSLAGDHALLVSCREYLALLRLQHVGSKDGPKNFSCTLYIPDLKQERPKGSLPPGLWADPSSLAGESAEGKGLWLQLCRLEIPIAPPNRPLSGLLECPFEDGQGHCEGTFLQVVTACMDSSVVVWDVSTGRKHTEVEKAHGHEEITAMAADPGQHRLVTAAANGTIKVWNLLNGQPLHKLEAVSDTEVTGVICLHDNKLLAVGWSQVVAQYSIGDLQDIYVKADEPWKSGQLHSDDILAVDHCPCLRLLATGSYDGEIIVWMVDTQRPVTRIQRPQSGRVYPPIDRLLFLQKRAQDSQCRGKPLLLSSQAGYICWWNVSGPKHKHGQFYVPHRVNECVKGLNTNNENSLLITGDGTGSIQIWDISQYDLSDEFVDKEPPLLCAWRAHEGAIVSMELLEQSGQMFLVTVSVDHSARLWTSDGGCVGSFGQEQQWDLSNPLTYQVNRLYSVAQPLKFLKGNADFYTVAFSNPMAL
ncbi:hypothetical protein P4O66_001530 [Electrophorus voltai]|uniref:EF-hand domain-containing protein n=1 Tax=Electrophorus voltai TaxID=2609070 RepID=A0AAD9DTW6_9TELE|nr:hypothetical protein P4O66_001530 [Electrophorus voltai]